MADEDIETIVYLGLGSTEADEKLAKTIRKASESAHKAHTDRLVKGNLQAGATVTAGDIAGLEALIISLMEDADIIGVWGP